MKKNKIVLILLFVIIALGAYFYISSEVSRKDPTLTEVKEDFNVDASSLLLEFENEADLANKKYLGKVILLSGHVKSVETDKKGFHTLVLGDSLSMSSVRCSMDSNIPLDLKSMKIGSNIQLKGECTGFNPDDLGLGADVVLNRSVVIFKN